MCGLIIVGLTLMTWISPTAGHEPAPPLRYVAQLIFGSSFLVQYRATERGSSPWMAASFAMMLLGLLLIWAVAKGYV